MKRRGIVVALSGLDSAGKSLQRRLLSDVLREWGREPVVVWTRAGYTPGLKRARRLLRRLRGRRATPGGASAAAPGRYPRRASNLGHPLRRRLWLTVAMLDLLWTCGVRVRLWRILGRTVICDRYLLDCMVDFAVNFPDDAVEERALFRLLRRVSPRPDAAFCLVVPAEESLRRTRAKTEGNWETLDVLEQRRQAYLERSEALGVRTLDGTEPADAVGRRIRRALEEVIGDAPPRRRAPEPPVP